MAKSKKNTAETQVTEVIMDVMPGADIVSENDAKPFEVDLNFDVQEDENEEVEEQNDDVAEEEVAEAEPEAEIAEGKTSESKAIGEEGVDEDSKSALQPDIQPIETGEQGLAGQNELETAKAPMVPKARLDEVLAKNKAMQKRLKEIEAAEQQAAQNAPEYDFDTKEIEYQDLVLNGETDRAVALRSEIRNAEKEQFMFEVQAKMGQTVKQSQEMTELQAKAIEIEATFSVLNENSADFDADLQAEVIELRDAFTSQGYGLADSLAKATEYALAVKRPDLLRTADTPAPTANQVLQQKTNTANVNKKLQAADAQPPAMRGESKTEKKVDLSVLSSDEFDALPAETLRRMRGDFG
jgi:hypothetical protein